MAIDNTPPRLRLIATIAIIMVITLVGLDFVFKSYYAFMSDQARREKMAPTQEKDEQHKADQAALSAAKVPVNQAIAQLAKGMRGDLVEPKPSEDLAPMTGWSKLPKTPPITAAHPAPGRDLALDPHGPHAAAAADAHAGADAGVAPAHSDVPPGAHAADAAAPAPHHAPTGAADGGHAAPPVHPHH